MITTPYMIKLGAIDSLRARVALAANGMVVALLSLLVLAIAGGKRGIADRMRQDILKSPTATEIKIYASGPGTGLSRQSTAELRMRLPGYPVIIPNATKVVSLSSENGGIADSVTCECTRKGDPFLAFHQCDPSDFQTTDVVLSEPLAIKLGSTNDTNQTDAVSPVIETVVLKTTRNDDNQVSTASLKLRVRGIIKHDKPVAWLDQSLLEKLDDYAAGRSVPEFGWAGQRSRIQPSYSFFLAFNRKPYDDADIRRLHLRGLTSELVSTESSDGRSRTLYGVLNDHQLWVYRISAHGDVLRMDANDIERMTSVDDVCLPWTPPRKLHLNGIPHMFVGLSEPRRWLKSELSPVSRALIEAGANDLFTVRLPSQWWFSCPTKKTPATVQLGDGRVAQVSIRRFDGGPWALIDEAIEQAEVHLPAAIKRYVRVDVSKTTLAILVRWCRSIANLRGAGISDHQPQISEAYVTPEILALAAGIERGDVDFDPLLNDFVAARPEHVHISGRVYAKSLEDVSAVDKQLRQLGYLTTSSRTRIDEMKGHIQNLDRLVRFLLIVIVSLGAFTMMAVFGDVTHRKRSTIGILRVMGATSNEIFWFVGIRGLLVAIAGWLICLPLCSTVQMFAPQWLNHECPIPWSDRLFVLLGAIGCCAIGMLLPSLHAITLDPVEAVTSGKTT